MAEFVYVARRATGERVEDTLDARDKRLAAREIERRGLIPVSITERAAAASAAVKIGPRLTWWHGRRVRMNLRDTLMFTTELSDLLGSGMTLGNALGALARRKTGKASDKIIPALRDEIIQGSSLSDALARQPDTFSHLYVNMIKAGEASGALHDVLRRLVVHYERVQEIKEKVVMALVYPSIVMVMGIGILIFAMLYIVPKFETVFASLKASLPMSTRILIGSSRAIARYGIFMLMGIVFLAVMANRWVKTVQGREWWHRCHLKAPLLKGVVAASTYATFARTLETLIANGVPLLRALGIVEKTVGNVIIRNEVRRARERVTDGTTISGPLAAGKVFPSMMIDMLSVGEQTGNVAGALSHIARRYENELERNLRIFTTALEPILIIVVAVLVGFVAISILMAVFSLTNAMGV